MPQCLDYTCKHRSSLTGFCMLTACNKPTFQTANSITNDTDTIDTCDTLKDLVKYIEENKNTQVIRYEFDKPINNLQDAAIILCLAIGLGGGCKNCPVTLFNYDKRTEYEKCSLHTPCQTNLYKWLLDQASKENVK